MSDLTLGLSSLLSGLGQAVGGDTQGGRVAGFANNLATQQQYNQQQQQLSQLLAAAPAASSSHPGFDWSVVGLSPALQQQAQAQALNRAIYGLNVKKTAAALLSERLADKLKQEEIKRKEVEDPFLAHWAEIENEGKEVGLDNSKSILQNNNLSAKIKGENLLNLQAEGKYRDSNAEIEHLSKKQKLENSKISGAYTNELLKNMANSNAPETLDLKKQLLESKVSLAKAQAEYEKSRSGADRQKQLNTLKTAREKYITNFDKTALKNAMDTVKIMFKGGLVRTPDGSIAMQFDDPEGAMKAISTNYREAIAAAVQNPQSPYFQAFAEFLASNKGATLEDFLDYKVKTAGIENVKKIAGEAAQTKSTSSSSSSELSGLSEKQKQGLDLIEQLQ